MNLVYKLDILINGVISLKKTLRVGAYYYNNNNNNNNKMFVLNKILTIKIIIIRPTVKFPVINVPLV